VKTLQVSFTSTERNDTVYATAIRGVFKILFIIYRVTESE
jgi:hypothetical protein